MADDDPTTTVESWLTRPGTKAEIEAAKAHFKKYNPSCGGRVVDEITDFQATMFALGIEILAALEMYGGDEPTPEEEFVDLPIEDEDDDDEPWRGRDR